MPEITPAHLHVLVNHLPIIGIPLVAILLAWGLIHRQDVLIRVAMHGAILMAIGSFITDQTGDGARADIRNEPWAERALIRAHSDAADWANIAALLTGAIALGLVVVGRGGRPIPRGGAVIVLVALLLSAAAMARTGWEGGKIRHSEFFRGATAPGPGSPTPE